MSVNFDISMRLLFEEDILCSTAVSNKRERNGYEEACDRIINIGIVTATDCLISPSAVYPCFLTL
jgi:hypothetical protein